MDVKGPAVAFTIWPNSIPTPRNKKSTRSALNLVDLQAVERDFAFIVDNKVEASDLVIAATGADKKLIQEYEFLMNLLVKSLVMKKNQLR